MKRKKINKRLTTPDRDRLISDGYFDGRFRPKTFINKKKEMKKRGFNE